MSTLTLTFIEAVALMMIGFPVTFLFWVIGGRKGSFGEFLNRHGYTIAIVSFLVLGLIYAIINTANGADQSLSLKV